MVGLLLGSLYIARSLAVTDWDPSLFAAFGEDAVPTREYAEERLGEVYLRSAQGHDGKFFFVQANDPWLLHPEDHAFVLDHPAYRSQRMLYPMLAGGAGALSPEAILWGMILVNLLALVVGTWVVARIALEAGGSAWWGLAFTLNVGLVSEMAIGGAGVVAAAALFAAVLAFMRDRYTAGVICLTLSVLARETMVLSAVGIALYLVWRSRKMPDLRLSIPFVAVAVWWLYLRIRLDGAPYGGVQALDLPLLGFAKALQRWMSESDRGFDILVGVLLLAVCLVVLYRTLQKPSLLAAAVAGPALLALFMSEPVWYRYFDSSRAVAPVLTAFVLLAFLASRDNTTRLPAGVSSDA